MYVIIALLALPPSPAMRPTFEIYSKCIINYTAVVWKPSALTISHSQPILPLTMFMEEHMVRATIPPHLSISLYTGGTPNQTIFHNHE